MSVDLARELARRLGVAVELVTVTSAGQSVETLKSGRVDVGLRHRPRARRRHRLHRGLRADRGRLPREERIAAARQRASRPPGTPIVVGAGRRLRPLPGPSLKNATLDRCPPRTRWSDDFLAHRVAAGVHQQIETDAKRIGGLRVLDGRFMVINQAMAMRKSARRGGLPRRLRRTHEGIGFVAEALKRHGIEGAVVAAGGECLDPDKD